jgi:hypothetical protein
MVHAGILLLPIEKLCPEPVAAARIDELVQVSTVLTNRCFHLTSEDRWVET